MFPGAAVKGGRSEQGSGGAEASAGVAPAAGAATSGARNRAGRAGTQHPHPATGAEQADAAQTKGKVQEESSETTESRRRKDHQWTERWVVGTGHNLTLG